MPVACALPQCALLRQNNLRGNLHDLHLPCGDLLCGKLQGQQSHPRGREQERRRSQRHGAASAVDRYTTNPVPLSAFEALGVVVECRHEHHYLVHPMLRSMK